MDGFDHFLSQNCPSVIAFVKARSGSRDGILGHQFNKRLKSLAPCYSQSLILADFKENHTLLWFYSFKNPYKNSAKNPESIPEKRFL